MAASFASFRPGRGLATALTVVLGLASLTNLAFAFIVGWIIYVFHAMASGRGLAELPFIFIGRWLGWDQLQFVGFFLPTLWPLRALIALTSNILFMIWLYRAHKNLAALNVGPLRYKSHWAITGYFVPFLNFYRPFQVVREVWKGSTGAPADQPTSPLVRVWWEFTILAVVLGEAISYIEQTNRLEASGLVLGGYLVIATVLLLQLAIVRRIHRWQLQLAGQAVSVPSREGHVVSASPLIDLAAVALVVLGTGALYWHSGRVVDDFFAQWATPRRAATPHEPPPPESGSGGDDKVVPLVSPKKIEGIEGGIPGGVEGGVVGGVVGGVPGGVPSSGPPAKPDSAPQRIRVSQGVSESKRIAGSPPAYPELARRARIEGTVVSEVIIDRNGRVSNIRVVSGHPMLVQAAIDAVKGWKYQPTMLNGEPVEVITTVRVAFRLSP